MWKPMLSCRPMKPRVGMVTIGQAPRVDVVPAMADVLGPDVEIIERGALDGLGGDEIAQLAPESDDEVLVTRLTDGSSVFVGKRRSEEHTSELQSPCNLVCRLLLEKNKA